VDGYVATGTKGLYPHVLAGTGDIDITGFRAPVSYYRETVFGLRDEPYIAVHRPSLHGRPLSGSPWSWDPVVSTWTWDAAPGAPVTVDVYSDAETVELVLDGVSLSTAPVGAERAFTARFETEYRTGELVAIARRGEVETGRATLRSADSAHPRLAARAELDRIGTDADVLAFVPITLEDAAGTPIVDADRVVSVSVEGPGVLAALGTGRISTEEVFGGTSCTTYDGRALAIVRPTGPGTAIVRVTTPGLEEATATIEAE
ncbi:MAG: DUF4982 domain-containing protein, partial [Microbacterium sp.]